MAMARCLLLLPSFYTERPFTDRVERFHPPMNIIIFVPSVFRQDDLSAVILLHLLSEGHEVELREYSEWHW